MKREETTETERAPRKRLSFLVLFIVILFAILAGLFQEEARSLAYRLDRISSNPNGFVRHFAPTWRSLKKIVDFPYTAIYTFRPSSLPTFYLSISDQNQMRLLDNLPDYPEENFLSEDFKQTVRASLSHDTYETDDAKVRYRGNSPRHWNALKKSWQINLPSGNPLRERTTLRLILPEDRSWFGEPLNAYRAKKFGAMTPELSFARLFVNGKNMGVYLLTEGWEESFVERNNKVFGPIFTNTGTSLDIMKPENVSGWKGRFSEDEMMLEETSQLAYFLKLLADAPDALFEEQLPVILDMEAFYTWMLVHTLAGSLPSNVFNQNLFWNYATGKFEPIVFDVGLGNVGDSIIVKDNRLADRILKNRTFRAEFEKVVRAYVSEDKNLADDLAFYDNLYKDMRPEILADTAKLPTNGEFIHDTEKNRKVVEENFIALQKMFEKDGTLAITFSEEKYPLVTRQFGVTEIEQNFLAVTDTKNEFLIKHTEFQSGSGNDVSIGPGTFSFGRTVIVPRGLRVSIAPGTHMRFGKNASFLSYSPISARGTLESPITTGGIQAGVPWGIFGVMNTDIQNEFRFVRISDGKDDTLNGVYFSGELTLRNADGFLSNITIERANADDGLHIVSANVALQYSTFSNNMADSIDIDYAEGDDSYMKGNFFRKGDLTTANGDAMDISFSKILIEENTVASCGDKGVSVGERSTPLIKNNLLSGCTIGLAVKDNSQATIENTLIFANAVGLDLYRKKPHFINGGFAYVTNTIIWGNNEEIRSDKDSHLSIEKSVVEGGIDTGYEGSNNEDTLPDTLENIIRNLPWARNKNLIPLPI